MAAAVVVSVVDGVPADEGASVVYSSNIFAIASGSFGTTLG